MGCVPKKITWNAASLAISLEHDMKDYGFDVEYRGFDWLKFKNKRDAYVRKLNETYRDNLKKVFVLFSRKVFPSLYYKEKSALVWFSAFYPCY